MKKLLPLFALMIGSPAFAQNYWKTVKIGPAVSLDLSNARRINRNGSAKTDNIIKNLEQGEKNKASGSLGLSILFPVKADRIKLQTGLEFSNYGYMSPRFEMDPGFPDGPSLRFITNYNYFELPLKVNYEAIKRKSSLYITAGASLARFYDSYITVLHRSDDFGFKRELHDEYGLVDWNVFAVAGLGWQKKLSGGKLLLDIQGRFKYGLIMIYEKPAYTLDDDYYDFDYYLWSAGLSTTLYFSP